jgi:APA family basic amino acid/polyamine antiporter
VSSVLITGLTVLNYNASLVEQFTFVILLATLTTLVPYVFSAAAQIMLLIKDRSAFSVRKLAGSVTIAGLALAYSVWMIAGSGYEVVYKGFLLLLGGIPVFLWLKYTESRRKEARIDAALGDMLTSGPRDSRELAS